MLRQKAAYATYDAAYDVAAGSGYIGKLNIKPVSNNAFEKEYLDVLNKTYNRVYERLKSGSVA